MYSLIVDDRAAAQIQKLPKDIGQRIFKKLDQACADPHRYFIKLSSRSEYKLRIGDYRVIADILDDKLIILVLQADHRRRVYKRL